MESNVGIGNKLADEAEINSLLADVPELNNPPEDKKAQEKSFLESAYEVIKGSVKGPAQLVRNVGETAAGKENDFTKFYSNPTEQIGVEMGAALTAAGAGTAVGAAAGSLAGPVGTVVGGLVGGVAGAMGYGFTKPTDESNAAQALRDYIGKDSEMATYLWQGLNKYAHQPGDTNLDKRIRNMFVEGILDMTGAMAGAGIAKGVAAAVSKLPEDTVSKITGMFSRQRKLDAVEKAVANVDSNITAMQAAKGGAESAENPTTILAKELQKDTQSRAETMAPELQKAGRELSESDVLSSHEIEYTQKKLQQPKIEGDVTDFTDDTIARLPEERIAAEGKKIDEVFSEKSTTATNPTIKQIVVENPFLNANRSSLVAAQNASKLSGKASQQLDLQAISESAMVKAADDNEIARIQAKFSAGERLEAEEIMTMHLKVQDTVLDPVLVEKMVSGKASPTDAMAYYENIQAVKDGILGAHDVSAAASREAGQNLSIASYLKKYADALPDSAPVPATAKMSAMQNALEKSGVKQATKEDAEAVLNFILNPSKEKVKPDVLAGLAPETAARVQGEMQSILQATKMEELRALQGAVVRSRGTTLAEGVHSYMVANMLLSVGTPYRVLLGIPSEVGMRVGSLYVGAGGEALRAMIQRKSLSGAAAELERANMISATIFDAFRGATKLQGRAAETLTGAFKAYKSGEYNQFLPNQGVTGAYVVKRAEKEKARRAALVAAQNLAPISKEELQIAGSRFGFIKDGIWAVEDSVRRILFSYDAAVSHIVEEAWIKGEAAFVAKNKGLIGEEFENFVRNPPEELIDRNWDTATLEANKIAARAKIDLPTLNAPYKAMASSNVDALFARFISPYYLAGANGIERILEYTPGAVVLPSVRKALKEGGRARVDVLSKAATGVIPVMGAMQLYRSNIITGPGKDHEVFDEDGQRVPPFHIKLWGKYVPINNVLGTGTLAGMFKMAGYLDSAIDFAKTEKYAAAFGSVLMGITDNGRYVNAADVFNSASDFLEEYSRAGSEDQRAKVISNYQQSFAKRFMPGYRLVEEGQIAMGMFVDRYEREKVVDGIDGVEYGVNLMHQMFSEIYTPGKLAYKPNFYGEPIKRSNSLFNAVDAYTPGQNGDHLSLKVLRDLADHGQMYGGEETGLDKLTVRKFPEQIKDYGETNRSNPGSGFMIRLTPELYNKYSAYVSGYMEDGTRLGGETYRERVEKVLEYHKDTVAAFYEKKPIDPKQYNLLVHDINMITSEQHKKASAMIRADKDYLDIVAQKYKHKEETKLVESSFGGE